MTAEAGWKAPHSGTVCMQCKTDSGKTADQTKDTLSKQTLGEQTGVRLILKSL